MRKGTCHLPETTQKISTKLKGRPHSEERKRNIGLANKGRPCPEEQKRKLSAKLLGHSVLEETRQKISLTLSELWKDEDFAKKMAEAYGRKPTKLEVHFTELLDELYPGEWKYVGDGEIWIGGKNPDFINIRGKKQVIEVFGDYWHRGEDPQERINHFRKYGFDCIVIWESELR